MVGAFEMLAMLIFAVSRISAPSSLSLFIFLPIRLVLFTYSFVPVYPVIISMT